MKSFQKILRHKRSLAKVRKSEIVVMFFSSSSSFVRFFLIFFYPLCYAIVSSPSEGQRQYQVFVSIFNTTI